MLTLVDADDARAREELAQVPAWFAEWENALGRFRADSELSRLNANAGRAFRVSETLWQVIQQSLNAAGASDGLATPCVLAALERAGYDRSFEAVAQTLPSPPLAGERTSSLLAPCYGEGEGGVTDWRAIECDADARTVCLPHGTRLDLGGIAKGWCAHQAAQRLSAYAPALVDAGGDIAVGGARTHGGAWQIAIADPLDPERDLEQLMVHAGGIATSGRDYRRWKSGNALHHHIIDPRTGRPAETDVLSATVIAPDVLQAETAAKVALILGVRAGAQWLDARPPLAGLLVAENGRAVASARFDEFCLVANPFSPPAVETGL